MITFLTICLICVIVIVSGVGIIFATRLAYKKGFNDGVKITASHNLDIIATKYNN